MAKKKVVPAPEGHESFTAPIWKQWQAWRKHAADNERRGRPDVYEGAPPVMDDNARLAFADWLDEKGHPLAPVVRRHRDKVYEGGVAPGHRVAEHPDHPGTPSYFTDYPPLDVGGKWDFSGDAVHPQYAVGGAVMSPGGVWRGPTVVWRHKGVTTSRSAGGGGRYREHPVMFHAPLTVEEYHRLADLMPGGKRAEWLAFAEHHGWKRPGAETPERLARNEGKQFGVGSAVRASATDNHDQRLAVARQLLSEAGLQPATVRSVLAHTDERGVRPGVAALVASDVHPDVARYVAAWLGLLTGERRVTVFHPGEGEDTLHVIDTPHGPDHVGEYLRRAGVPSFTLETHPAGTRAFVTNPLDLIDVTNAARGLDGRHTAVRGRAVRLGAGSGPGAGGDAEARAAYRSVIRDAESAAEPAAEPPG